MIQDDLKVFVYGTLKPGGHYWPEFCEGQLADDPVAAKIRGSLYDLHVGYPGLILDDRAWVYGFVLKMSSAAAFSRLDYLEGYAPGRPESQNEYNRLKVPSFNLSDEPLGQVWAYEMTPATRARHQTTLIKDGNWAV